MELHISGRLIPSLPAHGWSACLRRDDPKIRIFHGSGVETRSDFYAAAVWNGAFHSTGMKNSTLFFGTGGMLDEGRIIFKTSSDASAPLFSLQRRDWLFISNSIIHLMKLTGTGPVADYPFYTYDFIRNSRAGNKQPQGSIKHEGEGNLKVHFNTNIHIGRDFIMRFSPYGNVSEPMDFRSLVDIYKTEISNIFLNGADDGRKLKYGQTILCSSGYDSLMNAVVCSQLGCTDFLSVVDGRQADPMGDSAAIPLGQIGLKVHEVDRHIHQTLKEACDAEFALISTSNYPYLSGCEPLLRQRLLIGGSLGDHIWNPDAAGVFSDWKHWDKWVLAGFASMEHRLRVGYIDMNPEVMFALHAQRVSQIALTQEMLPFCLDNDYDRPIARRVIEEGGIPRGSFALRKRATAQKHFNDPLNLHQEARRSYEIFRSRNNSNGLRRYIFRGLYMLERWLYFQYFRRHQQKKNDDPDRFRLVALDGKRFEIPWTQAFLFHWSFEQLKDRYSGARQMIMKFGLSK